MTEQNPSKPFYGNSLCAKCNSPLHDECYWIKGQGLTPSEMAVCKSCAVPASEPAGDVVEVMLVAFYCPMFKRESALSPINKEKMNAAYRVAREHVLAEALEEPSENEMVATANAETNWKFTPNGDYDRVRRIFANRRKRLAHPPSIQRVTVEVSRGPEAIYRIDGRILSPEEIRQYIANGLESK